MLLVRGRDVPEGSVLSADICIVGGGPAGITIAMELAETDLDVILLESGDLTPAQAAQDLNEGRQIGIDTWSLRGWRLRMLGGATGHWEGFCRPLSPEDFEARSWLPGSGWPIGYADVLPYYQRAHATCEIGEFDYDGARLSERLGLPTLTGADAVLEHRYYRLSPPTRFGERYREVLEASDAIRTVLDASVVELTLEPDFKRLERIRCMSTAGNGFHIEAKHFVLATGGIENARLLLTSQQQLEGGIANQSGLVGRGFMEHPHYLGSATMAWAGDPDLRYYRSTGGVGLEPTEVTYLPALGLRAEVRESEKLLNMSCTISTRDGLEDLDTGAVTPPQIGALLGRVRGCERAHRLRCRFEQRPIAESRVILDSRVDAFGVPRVALDWRIAEEDLRGYYRGLRVMAAELSAEGLGRMWIPHEQGALRFSVQPGGHHMGTTRMGIDRADSVVDGDGACHYHPNLFVAGSSVFVTGGDANPTLTVVALAHRLGEHLRNIA